MKGALRKVNLIFLIVAPPIWAIISITTLNFFAFSTGYSQVPSKNKNRTKDFGKSLDKYKDRESAPDRRIKKADDGNGGVIRVETNLVLMDVLVVNPKGSVILGLKKDDFVVTENGVSQELELFSNRDNE